MSLIRELSFSRIGPFENLALALAPRLNLLAGDNGLGKSLVLEVLWWAVTGTWAGDPILPGRSWEQGISRLSFVAEVEQSDIPITLENMEGRRGRHRFAAEFHRRTQHWRPSPLGLDDLRGPALALYIKVDGSVAIWDALRSQPESYAFGLSRTSSKGLTLLTHQEIWDGKRQGGEVQCAGLIQDWTTWQHAKNMEFAQLTDVLKILSSPTEPMIPGPAMRVRLEDRRDIPSIILPYDTIPITQVSAGMKRILSLAYAIVWAWSEHQAAAALLGVAAQKEIILLIDELEAHLHPQWQRTILPALLAVLQGLVPSTQIVISTHAPLVLSSLEPFYAPTQDALWKLDLVEGRVQVEKDEWQRRGTVDRWLTSDVFDLKSSRNREAEHAIHKARQTLKNPQISVEQLREIHHQLQASLGESDPFWPLWLERAHRAGIEP